LFNKGSLQNFRAANLRQIRLQGFFQKKPDAQLQLRIGFARVF